MAVSVSELSLSECLAERGEGKQRHFEMLEPERDADYRDAADESEDEMSCRDLPPSQQDPKHIHEYAEASSGVAAVHNVSSERPQRENPELPQLVSEWDADDGHAVKQPCYEVAEGNQQTSQNEP